MAKGLQAWSVKESGAPITNATIQAAPGTDRIAFTDSLGKPTPTRALMGVAVPTHASATLTLELAGGIDLVIPNAALPALFAPGAILPFSCTAYTFSDNEVGAIIIAIF